VMGLTQFWEDVVRPTLIDYQGDAWFASTPRRGSDFERLYKRQESGWASWTFTTWDNPHIPREELEEARRTMDPEAYAREIMADFEATDSELVYTLDPNRTVTPATVAWADCRWRVVGIDPGGGDVAGLVECDGAERGLDRPAGGEARERLAREVAERADLIIFVLDSDITDSERKALSLLVEAGRPVVVALNKRDLDTEAETAELLESIRAKTTGLVPQRHVLAVAAEPRDQAVVRIDADGNETSTVRTREPVIEELRARLWDIVEAEGKTSTDTADLRGWLDKFPPAELSALGAYVINITLLGEDERPT